jgi:heme oxygenase (biliverdin-IX-beta and delta-forming)
MITESLKTATRIPHAELEKTLVARIRGTRTRSDYRQLLELFYGFYKPLEECIAPFLGDGLPDFADRRKAASILHDLRPLDGSHAQKLCTDLPHIRNVSQSLGAMYVMEGSTLGGRIITKMLSGNLQDEPGITFSFFEGYGDQTDTMWAAFKDKLNNHSNDTASQEEMITAAHETFIKFKHWIVQYEQAAT